MPDNPELVTVPQDLTLIGTEELQELETRAVAEFMRLGATDDVTPEALERQMTLADGIDRMRAELQVRDDRAKREAAATKAKLASERQRLQTRILGNPETGEAPAVSPTVEAPVDAESIAAAAARGATAALVAALGDRSGLGRDLAEATKRATASLSDASRYAPKPNVAKTRLAVRASVDIPGVARGDSVADLAGMAELFHRKARTMPVTRNNPSEQLVASISNEFSHTVDDRTSPRDVEELFRHLTRQDAKEALLAAGGWCAPSEIRYDFFNIACEDGLIDLPTFGVSRGGIRFPVSPSLADVFGDAPNQAFGGFSVPFNGSSIPWLWTETDDEAAATGATPRKPCIRVPCPEFEEERLECYGVCLTAGNLTDDAYPENTQNFLRLLMSAHTRAKNARFIATMASLSETCVTGGAFAAGGPAYNALVSGIALAATDYRERFGMCADDILEVVVPKWILGVIQADLARRSGTDALLSVTQAQIQAYFTDRNVRVQFVSDWQVRGAGQFGNATKMTAWPTSVSIMVYAAGTFILGNGLALDLGVVRDSTLNETNDHTAAWTEECHLIAKVGHESRCYTIAFDVAGDTCCTDLSAAIAGAGIL
jgi:hypothetical protein